jgi:hypothetical protein
VPSKAEQLNRYASIRTAERLCALLDGAGFSKFVVQREFKSFAFASFEDYFAGIEAGAGIAGQEYVKLPQDLQSLIREDTRQSFPGGHQQTVRRRNGDPGWLGPQVTPLSPKMFHQKPQRSPYSAHLALVTLDYRKAVFGSHGDSFTQFRTDERPGCRRAGSPA